MTPLSLTDFVPAGEVTNMLARLVRIDTSNPPGEERPAAEFLADVCAQAGLQVTLDAFAPQRANVLARYPGRGSRPALLFSGHLDTVPAGPDWGDAAHSAAVCDGVLHGRGSVDMKGGVTALVAACIAASRARLELSGDLLFAGTAGEEVDAAGARRLLTQRMPPVGEIVVAEPTRLDIAPAHKGALWLEILSRGVAAHGAMPEQGRNAILTMHRIIQAFGKYRTGMTPHPLLGPPTMNIGTISGGVKPNIVPDRCILTLDIRTLPGRTMRILCRRSVPWRKTAPSVC
jgi:succinyl-diaminopimelate desuccinylase